MGVLTIKLEKLTSLKDRDGLLNASDPYVTFHCEKERIGFDKNYGNQKSSVKKNTTDPVYNETFTFNDIDSLDNLALHIKVYDSDIGRDDHMGGLSLKLEKMLVPGEEKEIVEKLERTHKGLDIFSERARIHMKLTYTE